MTHHYREFMDTYIKTQEENEETPKKEQDSPLYESDDEASTPLPKTNIPACSNMTE